MSLFFAGVEKVAQPDQKLNIETLHKHQCIVCPLNKIANKNPHIPASGSEQPLVYVLNDFPTEHDDKTGKHLSGPEGDFILNLIPDKYLSKIRYNAIVRTKPKKGIIEFRETECCRPSVIKDIEKSKPKAIIGLGPSPLNWALGNSGINDFRGRRALVKVGGHSCYYYPVLHPTTVLKGMQKNKFSNDIFEHITQIDFKRIFSEIESLPDPNPVDLSTLYDGVEIITDNLGRIRDFFNETVSSNKAIGFDIETKNFRPYKTDSKILSFAFGIDRGRTIAFPLDHKQAKWTDSQKLDLDKDIQKYFLTRKNIMVAHNLAFEMEWMAYFYGEGVLRAANWADTMAQAYVLDERYRNEVLKLDTLCSLKLGLNLKEQSNIDVANLDNIPLEKVLKYNALDSKYTVELCRLQHQEIKNAGLGDVYKEQVRTIPTMVLTQLKGLDIDQPFVKKVSKDLEQKITKVESDIQALPEVQQFKALTKEQFNPGSSPHTIILLRDILKHESTKKTAGGNFAADKDILGGVKHPVAKLIIEYKELVKIKSTYIDNLNDETIDGDVYPDGKVHTSLNGMFTTSSRLSSNGPNIQNQPRKKNKELVRPAFTAPANHTFVSLDYGQIEARVIAMYSKDKVFVKALWDKYDVHQEWAEKIARAYPLALGDNSEPKAAMKKLRDRVKNMWVFPSFFGAGKKTVAGYMKIPVEKTDPLFEEFWDTFKGVHIWQKELGKFYKKNGYVEFLNGRRRRGPLMWSEMINAPVQGFTANLVCDAYNRLSERSDTEEKPWLQPVMQIHDDLSFVIPDKELDDALETIISDMLTFDYPFINVPISVEISAGSNWYDKQPIETGNGKCDGAVFSNEWNK